MSTAKIYQPAKTAMQSGLANTKFWILEFIPKNTRFLDPIMGWTGNSDVATTQIKLKFSSKEEAIEYAQKSDLDFMVVEPHQARQHIKSYIDNYKQYSKQRFITPYSSGQQKKV